MMLPPIRGYFPLNKNLECHLPMNFPLQPVSVPPISELGPDALLEPMTVDEFYKALSKKKIGIKALLLDQVRNGFLLLCD